MRYMTFYLCILFIIFLPNDKDYKINYVYGIPGHFYISPNSSLTEMEALDLVKEQYAANFEKVYPENTSDTYYYRLPSAEYYLEYAGQGETSQYYLFHLYEFVLDDPETGLGHMVTYGWYTVNQNNGFITEQY